MKILSLLEHDKNFVQFVEQKVCDTFFQWLKKLLKSSSKRKITAHSAYLYNWCFRRDYDETIPEKKLNESYAGAALKSTCIQLYACGHFPTYIQQ